MVGLILLYFVGKAFYDLAGKNGKGQWLYAILGVISYYGGSFVGGILLAIGYELFMDGSIDDLNDTLLGVLALPFGVLACWGFYHLLKNHWTRKETFAPPEEILDANLMDHNSENRNL
jgi:hypothetical protein